MIKWDQFKPMLAGVAEPEKLVFPVYASPKYDGVRGTTMSVGLRSRKLLEFPNHTPHNLFNSGDLCGFDGELVLRGMETKPGCFHATSGALAKQTGKPDLMFHVFDDVTIPDQPFTARYDRLLSRVEALTKFKNSPWDGWHRVKAVENRFCLDLDELLQYEEELVDAGWEGVMVRSPEGLYKFGRSTVNEGALLKFKRFVDSEAVILSVKEQLTNTNEATVDALGHVKKSKKKAGLLPAGTLGAFEAQDLTTGVTFSCAPGILKAVEAQALFAVKNKLLGRVIKYRFQKVGTKDKPRFPRFQGFREDFDY